MTREEAIKMLKALNMMLRSPDGKPISDACDALDMAIEALQTEPNKAVQPSLADVYKWERDIALSQLEEYGIGFAEKKRDDLVEVVRKPIKGYEDYYEVDQFGRVFAKERTIHVIDHDREYDKHLPSRQMKQSVHTKGYKTVPLTKDGVCTTKFVHRLVAEAFIPNPDDLPFVNHIDEDKTNNFVENLEWCTEQYNSTYGKAREKHAKALKGRPHTEEHKKKISDSLKRFYGERKEP